jgi:hypothetical protein
MLHIRKYQHARPNAPKPIHPDKEHFAPNKTRLGANIQSIKSLTFAGITTEESKHDFPHNISNTTKPVGWVSPA